ncbi:MAG: SdpI family protein, partial [Gemmiger sp.]|nr:SdpI family protein [Gemmiger sp.]
RSGKAWPILQILLVVFMAAVSWATEFSVWGIFDGQVLPLLITTGVGVLFLVLGNYMPQIKQNYTLGAKTPWALHDEHNWQRTQRMGGIVFMAMGGLFLLGGPLSAVLGSTIINLALPALVLLGVAWLYLYSYLVFIGKMK